MHRSSADAYSLRSRRGVSGIETPELAEGWLTMPTPDAEKTVPRDKPSKPPVPAAISPREAAPKRLHGGPARFEQTVLLLQGGGALGSYQAGVYQALAVADLHPDWVAGISIGAINS